MIYHAVSTNPDGSGTWGTFNDLRVAVDKAVHTIGAQRADGRIDAIAVQGTSGMCIGFPVAYLLDMPIVVIRKPDEDSHDGYPGEAVGMSDCKGKRFLFVDDFVSMGTTRTRVREGVEKVGGKLVAEYMSREDYVVGL